MLFVFFRKKLFCPAFLSRRQDYRAAVKRMDFGEIREETESGMTARGQDMNFIKILRNCKIEAKNCCNFRKNPVK